MYLIARRLNKTVLGEGLLATLGNQHARQRKMLNPVFHIKHMRKLVGIFYNVADRVFRLSSRNLSSIHIDL